MRKIRKINLNSILDFISETCLLNKNYGKKVFPVTQNLQALENIQAERRV